MTCASDFLTTRNILPRLIVSDILIFLVHFPIAFYKLYTMPNIFSNFLCCIPFLNTHLGRATIAKGVSKQNSHPL